MNKLCPFCGKEPIVVYVGWVKCIHCNVELRTEQWNTREIGSLKCEIMNICRAMPNTPIMQELYDKVSKI